MAPVAFNEAFSAPKTATLAAAYEPAPVVADALDLLPATAKHTLLRILVLHGYAMSAEMMRRHLTGIMARLEGIATFSFITAPLPVEFIPDDVFPSMAEGEQSCAWWSIDTSKSNGLPDGALMGNGIMEALEALRTADAEAEREHGSGFNCVWGFSQGGAVASVAVALLQAAHPMPSPPLPSLKCAAFFACRNYTDRPKADYVPTFVDLFPPAAAPFTLPSLHIFGPRDTWIPLKATRLTADSFSPATRTVHEHNLSGHRIPDDEDSLKAMEEWVRGMRVRLLHP